MTTIGVNSWIWIDNAVNFILFAYFEGYLRVKPQKLIVFDQNKHMYPTVQTNESSYPSTLRDPRVFETNDPRGLANMQTERNPSNQGATIVV